MFCLAHVSSWPLASRCCALPCGLLHLYFARLFCRSFAFVSGGLLGLAFGFLPLPSASFFGTLCVSCGFLWVALYWGWPLVPVLFRVLSGLASPLVRVALCLARYAWCFSGGFCVCLWSVLGFLRYLWGHCPCGLFALVPHGCLCLSWLTLFLPLLWLGCASLPVGCFGFQPLLVLAGRLLGFCLRLSWLLPLGSVHPFVAVFCLWVFVSLCPVGRLPCFCVDLPWRFCGFLSLCGCWLPCFS